MNDLRTLIDAVRARVDLTQLISSEVDLRPSGSVLKGRSPFRPDSDPSFVVWPETQTWRDFSGGSDDGGDCFDYIKQRDGVGFMEALRALASEVGVCVPNAHSAEELERLSERRRVQQLLTEAARYYHARLPEQIRADWYRGRYGFTDKVIDKLLLGWADGHLYTHMIRSVGATPEEALTTGLFIPLADGGVVDFFKGRLVFPYWLRGRVVYFIARKTEHTPSHPWESGKYKKLLTRSEKHPYISHAVTNDTFYNEDAARGAERLLITEGVTDCISAMQAGVACISPVTTRFRRRDLPKLLALSEGAKEVIIANDAEDSGAGAEGAAETANALHEAGRDVRIAILPRLEGVEKLDLNELIAKGGTEALERVLDEAHDWCEHLINQIPEDTERRELSEHLLPILPLVLAADPIMREAYTSALQRRFNLTRSIVKAMLKDVQRGAQEAKRTKEQPKHEDPTTADQVRGGVFENNGHYSTLDRDGTQVRISSFIMKVNRWIASEDGDVVDIDIHTTRGDVFRGVRLKRSAWNSRRSFTNALTSHLTTWMGSDDNIQALLDHLSAQPVPTLRGTKNLGFGEDERGPYWALPHGVIEPKGQEGRHKDILWIESGGTLHKRISPIPTVSDEEARALTAEALPRLLEVNTPEVILPIIGWFFIAPLRPRVFEMHRSFPNLCVYGTQGSGKTSLIVKVMWPLLGISSAVPFSCTETKFSLIKLLSDTNSIPVLLDEYKPADMSRSELETIHRLLRRLYTGETEQRGRTDLSVVDHFLTAPVVLGGESRPIEPALAERMITANPSKTTLEEAPHYVDAFKALETMDLGRLAPSLIAYLLERDVEATYQRARAILNARLIELGRVLPHRMRFNLEVALMGLLNLEGYAHSLGVHLPKVDLTALIQGQIDDLLEDRNQVKSALDFFLEILSTLAVSGHIEHGRQYTYSRGLLALHLPSCHAAYTQHCKRTDYNGEIVDQRALRRLIREEHRRGGYVTETTVPSTFDGVKRRSVLIDMDKAKVSLDVDDFPQEPFNTSTGYAVNDWSSY